MHISSFHGRSLPVSASPHPRVPASPRLRVSFFHGRGFHPWTPDDLDRRPLGGLETAAIWLARELAALGHEVAVYGDCAGREGDYDGVRYRHWTRHDSAEQVDLLVVTRYLDTLAGTVGATVRWLWVHDNDPGIGDLAGLDRANRILALSRWHRAYLSLRHGIAHGRITVTRNGIDLSRFAARVRRDRHRLIYANAVDRGLDTVLEMWPAIRSLWPDAELHVFADLDAALSQAALGRPELAPLGERIDALRDQDGVCWRGRVDQRTLAVEFLRSDAWLYPTRVKETFCITALEAQAAGCIPIVAQVGALPEVVRGGLLLPPGSRTEHYLRALTQLDDPARRKALARAGREFARLMTWDRVAREWEEMAAFDLAEALFTPAP